MNSTVSPPEIAIIGHPNEGKSSVLSTLAEDDSVKVSATPGETTECRSFPVVIDGREILKFTDTPGFQNPLRVVAELRKIAESGEDVVTTFRSKFKNVAELRDDVELMLPVERGAGIIYVVDGSRPVRNVDRAEMEILRLTGRPRMAIINCKDKDEDGLGSWKDEFRKNFNTNRVFNAHRATYAERILLLEALKSIDQDWHPVLDTVVKAFKKDWSARNAAAAEFLVEMLISCLQYTTRLELKEGQDQHTLQQQLVTQYQEAIERKEQKAHEKVRALFKHNIFRYQLPPGSILHENLFSEKTWHLLGLSKKQVAIAGAVGGAVIGAKLDLIAAGLTFGLFTGIGGAAGAAGAFFGGKKLSQGKNILGLNLGGEGLKIGPANDVNMLLILLNRAFVFYRHIINWAHGRRDYSTTLPEPSGDAGSAGFTSSWSGDQLRLCKAFFQAVIEHDEDAISSEGRRLSELIEETLGDISQHE